MSFSAVAGRRSASGASTCARRSARASGSAASTSSARCSSVSTSAGERRGPAAPGRTTRRPRATARAGPTTASLPRSARSSAVRRAAVRVGHQQQRRPPSSPAGPRPAAGCAASTAGETGRTCDSGTRTAVSVGGGSQSARSAAATTASAAAPVSRCAGEPLEVALPDPAAALQLVGVAGDAGGGELVDVGEDQLGEARPAARRRCPRRTAVVDMSRQETRAPMR